MLLLFQQLGTKELKITAAGLSFSLIGAETVSNGQSGSSSNQIDGIDQASMLQASSAGCRASAVKGFLDEGLVRARCPRAADTTEPDVFVCFLCPARRPSGRSWSEALLLLPILCATVVQ